MTKRQFIGRDNWLIPTKIPTVQVELGHSGSTFEGLTQINISIPLDVVKYLKGKSLIECIDPKALPTTITDIKPLS